MILSDMYSLQALFVNAVVSLTCSFRQMVSSQSVMHIFRRDVLTKIFSNMLGWFPSLKEEKKVHKT